MIGIRLNYIFGLFISLLCFLGLTGCSIIEIAYEETVGTISSVNSSEKRTEEAIKLNSAIVYFTRNQNIEGANSDNVVTSASLNRKDSKILGNTELLASWIQEYQDCPSYSILVKTPYSGNYQQHIQEAEEELEKKLYPEIMDNLTSLEDYDVIFLGYPLWLGEMPMPVRSFLKKYDLSGKTIAPFISSGGSTSVIKTIEMMREFQPNAKILDYFFTTTSHLEDSKQDVKK